MPSDNFKKTETMKEEFVRSFSSAHQVIHCNYMYIIPNGDWPEASGCL